MDSPQDSFENLRRALALKRHEQPPPGYFDSLRHQVLHRLTVEQEAEPEDWFEALLERFRLRPALVGFFSFAMGAFYLAGLGYSQRLAPPPEADRIPLRRMDAFERRPPAVVAPWVPTVVASHSQPSSVAPVIQAGPPASVPSFPRPYLPGGISPASYVTPAP